MARVIVSDESRDSCSDIDLLGLAGRATNLGKQQVDTEGSVLVGQVALELGDLLLEHIGGVANTTDDTQTTGVGDSSRQLGAGGHVHTSQQNWVVDLEKISDGGTDNLWKMFSGCEGQSGVPTYEEKP